MAFIEVDEQSISAVLNAEFSKDQIVILKFGSQWCDACHALESELEDVDDENENVSVVTIDTDDYAELASMYDVRQLPTMIIYRDAKTPIYKGEGVLLASDIEEIFNT